MPSTNQVHDAIERMTYAKENAWFINECDLSLLMDGNALRERCKLLLRRSRNWKGVEAREVKQILREFAELTN